MSKIDPVKGKDRVTEVMYVSTGNGLVEYTTTTATAYEGKYGEKFLTHSVAMDILRKIMGKTLTLIDSSIIDKQQNKAMKDIMRETFSNEMAFLADLCFDQDSLNKAAEENWSGIVSDTATVEEVLGVK